MSLQQTMQTIHLDSNASKKIDQQFTRDSLIKGRLDKNENFIGSRTVKIHSINTVPLNDYDRGASANRYGTPTEVGDTIQEMTMTQDKGFSGVIDKGNNMDQSINKAGQFLRVQQTEEVIPAYDRYCFERLAHLAGTICGDAAEITAANVIARMSKARAVFLNHRVPLEGRTWYVNTLVFNALCDTDHFKNLQNLGGKALIKGQVGELFGAPVVEAPEDLLPGHCNFLLVHKRSATAPEKISEAKTHIDPPGISGNLVEGRYYYDLFVYAQKCWGVYADFTTGAGKATVCAPPTISEATGVITPGSGYTAKYTVDGSDPRYSATAETGTAPTVQNGTIVKAVNTKTDAYMSAVVSMKIKMTG